MRPRIRTIKPELWADERIGALSRDARVLHVGLVTIADDEGRFRAPTSALLGHIFQYDDDAPRHLKKWVAEVKTSSMVLFYVVDGVPYGAFRHWAKHQKINRPSPSDLPAPPDPVVVRENGLIWTGRTWKQSHGTDTDPDGNGHGGFHENSGSDHGSFSESSVSVHSSPRGRAFRSDPDPVVEGLNELLAARIRENDPKADPRPDSDRWRTDMRLLVAERDGDVDEVRRVLLWSQADSFWRGNILSPGKLRKQFTQLLLKSTGGQVLQMTRKPNASDLLRALNGDAA